MSKVTGADDIAAVLRAIPREAAQGFKAAARKSLRPMLKAAKANAPVDDRDLQKSLAIVADPKAPRDQPRFLVRPRSKYRGKDGSNPSRYAHLTEKGRADGSMAGTHWMTRAFEETKAETIETLGREVWPEIEKVVARRARSAKR